jgi:aryl-alcohol dehydrogenase-like predicted oxidoreductase
MAQKDCMVDWSTTGMEYRHLGRTGLKVSALSIGSWVTYGGTSEEDTSLACMTRALELGCNFFDCAEVYADGTRPPLYCRMK